MTTIPRTLAADNDPRAVLTFAVEALRALACRTLETCGWVYGLNGPWWGVNTGARLRGAA